MNWNSWRPATCLPNCWCEATRLGSTILEPVNAWTNIIFVTTGLIFLLLPYLFINRKNILTSDAIFPRLYGFAMIFVGLGSFFFHSSQTFVGQWFDVFGMYLVTMFYISYNFLRIRFFNKTSFLIFYLASTVVLGFIIYFIPETRRWLFGVSIIFIILQSVLIQLRSKPVMQNKFLVASIISYVVAQVMWVLDKNRIWCEPESLINGHAIWHVLTAVSAILAYFYFASEENRSQHAIS